MDCRSVRLLLDFARPRAGELEAGDAAALENHLADCPDCAALARHERRLDAHLGQAMQAVPIPADLRPRLLRRLAVERDAWYRRWLLRSFGIAGAAAVLCLLIWGGWLWHSQLPQDIDWVRVLGDEDRPTGSPAKVAEWFQETYGIHTRPPSSKDFDYTWLVHYSLEDFSGQRVPMLLFAYNGQDGQARAKVYILTKAQFQRNQLPRGSGLFKVDCRPNPEDPDIFYILIYTEGAEGRFWSKRKNTV